MIKKITDTDNVAGLFRGMSDTAITSCLQGVMGEVYAEDAVQPQSAFALLGGFCFLAGEADGELLMYGIQNLPSIEILVPQDDSWSKLIEQQLGQKARKITRYAIKKEGDVFDIVKLRKGAVSLGEKYQLKMIDEKLYHQCKKEEWSIDLVHQYEDYEIFEKLGLGVVALYGEKIVAGCSSYSTYREGVEIEVVTHEDYRRVGLAYACASRMLLECLSRGLYPSWDAANLQSVALAQKLGYNFSHEYPAYLIER